METSIGESFQKSLDSLYGGRTIATRRAPPSNTALGGDIFVHGRGAASDWTWGCIALDDADMKELYDAIDVGTPITIRP